MKDRIKKIRKSFPEQGKNQETFANFLGIPQTNLASYETGRRNPTDAVIQLICEKCNVNRDYLVNGEGPMKKEIDTEYDRIATLIGARDEKAKQAIIDYWKLSPEDKDLFWNFIERFIKGRG